MFAYIPSRYSGSGYKYMGLLRQEYGGVVLAKGNLKEQLRELNSELVFCQGDWMSTYLGSLRLGIPYILIEHDVMSLRTRLTQSQKRQEREMIENASALIFTSEDHAQYVIGKYDCPEYRVIHLRPLARDLAFAPVKRKIEKSLVYAGGLQPSRRGNNLYGYRTYHQIFRAFMEAGWQVHLYPNKRNAKAAFDYRSLGCVIHDSLPYKELLREMGRYRAGLLAYARDGTPKRAFAYTQKCRPNKTWDYLAAGIPTIAVQAGNTSQILVDGGWGIAADSLKPEYLESLDKKLPGITEKMRFSQVMDNDKKKFQELIDIALSDNRRMASISPKVEVTEIEGGKIVMAEGNKWFITTKRVMKNGRLLYGKNRRIPYTEALRLGLVEESRKPGPSENKIVGPSENKDISGPEEIFYCGSLTKSGRPCKRKVKNKGDKCPTHNMPFVREGEHGPAD